MARPSLRTPDRKSTRLNSSHSQISYAVFCLKNKHPTNILGPQYVVHRGPEVDIFVDGCFWHGCPRHFRPPKTRTTFWREKVRRNKGTRTRVLRELGPSWRVFQFYECDLEENLDECAKKVASSIRDSGRRRYLHG